MPVSSIRMFEFLNIQLKSFIRIPPNGIMQFPLPLSQGLIQPNNWINRLDYAINRFRHQCYRIRNHNARMYCCIYSAIGEYTSADDIEYLLSDAGGWSVRCSSHADLPETPATTTNASRPPSYQVIKSLQNARQKRIVCHWFSLFMK